MLQLGCSGWVGCCIYFRYHVMCAIAEGSFDYRPYVKDLYSCTLKKLMATDIDQEVKERAISCM
jgi:hypothetical protein